MTERAKYATLSFVEMQRPSTPSLLTELRAEQRTHEPRGLIPVLDIADARGNSIIVIDGDQWRDVVAALERDFVRRLARERGVLADPVAS